VSEQRPRSMDIGLCLFRADRPFRLGHSKISFGICSNKGDAKALCRGMYAEDTQ
jgi:hypothetical protein